MHSLFVIFSLLPLLAHCTNVVLSNDDGWAEKNIRTFYDDLVAAGDSVVLSAPADNKSGTGSSDAPATPLLRPCEFNSCPAGSPAQGSDASNPRLNYVNSYPVTSMRYGIQTLSPRYFGQAPDIAVAGPNVGANLGSTVLVSGTVGAATEAAKEGIPAIAFSGTTGSQISYTAAQETYILVYGDLSTNITRTLAATAKPYLLSNVWLNVNYPAVSGSTCSSATQFKYVLSRINSAGLGTAADVNTCGSTRLPTETTVVNTSGCYASISVGIATTKGDASSAQQAVVLGHYENVTQPTFGVGELFIGQIYVEKLAPVKQTKKYPLVFIAGAGQTGTNFLNTPDNRKGWASYFLNQGYTVYLTDQPQRGRSPWVPGEGTVAITPVNFVQAIFTASEKLSLDQWPQASLHTQWPGTGLVGDPIFDAFYSSQVQLQTNAYISDANNKAADIALLDTIGPCILVTHSQAGPYGWVAADARPNLVKGIVAVEPEGPPFVNATVITSPTRVYGITRLPLLFDPPVTDPSKDLKTVMFPPAAPDLLYCTRQAEPARKLVNLAKVPVALVTGEASYHAPYDYCTVAFLKQAGVNVEHFDLGARGIHGNGHFPFMEKNNLQIAALVGKWLRQLIEAENRIEF